MRTIARIFAGPVMALAGLNHFLNPEFYERIIPPVLPAPTALVYVSGAAELIPALATMHPRTRRAGGIVLIVVLIGVFPANVYMAFAAEEFPSLPAWAVWGRLALQPLFVYLVWLATLKPEVAANPSESRDDISLP